MARHLLTEYEDGALERMVAAAFPDAAKPPREPEPVPTDTAGENVGWLMGMMGGPKA